MLIISLDKEGKTCEYVKISHLYKRLPYYGYINSSNLDLGDLTADGDAR